jgi:uncharacterized protein YndB with AHSA1/START domain
MATKEMKVTGFLPAPPRRVYDAWLDAKGHGAMTGSRATVESTEIGGRYTAWAGYIEGTHIALEPGRRIFQSWRATDFPADAPESYVEVTLEPDAGGTRITIRHTEVPERQAAAYRKGWTDFYLKPMARYFAAPGRKAARPKRTAPAKGARKAGGTRPGDRRRGAAKKATAKKATAPRGRPAARKRAPARRRR